MQAYCLEVAGNWKETISSEDERILENPKARQGSRRAEKTPRMAKSMN
jgi:hypothetical protein